jgi:hypothetical protein
LSTQSPSRLLGDDGENKAAAANNKHRKTKKKDEREKIFCILKLFLCML